MSYELRVKRYELRDMNYELRVMCYDVTLSLPIKSNY